MDTSSKDQDEEMVDMYEDFPTGGPELDIPDTGVSDGTDIDVADLLEA